MTMDYVLILCGVGYLADVSIWHVTIIKTNFTYNLGNIEFDISAKSSIQLLEVTFSNNNFPDNGLHFGLSGKSRVLVSNSLFSDNINFDCTFILEVEDGYNETEILINNSRFTNNLQHNPHTDGGVTTCTVGLVYDSVTSLCYADISIIITLIDVEISYSNTAASTSGGGGSLFIHFLDSVIRYSANINLTRVNLISNNYLVTWEGQFIFGLVVMFT